MTGLAGQLDALREIGYPAPPVIGSLFSGYGGLDDGVASVLGGRVAWHSEVEPAACRILAHHWPDVPNLGDISRVDWAGVAPVDVLTGGFPCFVAGTVVTTQAGQTPIESVEVGQEVLTHLGRWRPVVQTMARDGASLWKVKAQGAPTVTTTGEHPFYVRRAKESAPEWVAAKELTRGMFVSAPGGSSGAERAPGRAYLIGRWLGDGWTVTHARKGRRESFARRVHWCCAPAEADALAAHLAATGVPVTRDDTRTVVKFVVQSAEWADLLDEFGKYAHGKYLPSWVHEQPLLWQADLLRGWLDADGDIKRDGTVNGTTVSRGLVVSMARVARTVHNKPASVHAGGPGGLAVIEGRTVAARPWWNLRIAPGPARQAFTDEAGLMWLPVRTAAQTKTFDRVYNIGVQEDESYVADGLIVHNCQDVSHAGKRAGIAPGTRSGLWAEMQRAIQALRPSLVIAENVRGLLSAKAAGDVECCPWCVGDGEGEPPLRALGAVLGDLAELGYDAWWCGLRAADAGAPHGRFRVFVFAWPAPDAQNDGLARPGASRAGRHGPADNGGASADTSSERRNEGRPEPARFLGRLDAAQRGPLASHADDDGRARVRRVDPLKRDLDGRDGADELRPAGQPEALAWGDYEPAIRRWEHVTGRLAPAPTEPGSKGQPRLAPVFVEWMQGLDEGHVTAVPGVGRNAQLKALGNGVVPQQAALATQRFLAWQAAQLAAVAS